MLFLEKLKSIKEIVEQVPEILNYQGNICGACDKTFNHCSEDARYCVQHNEDLKKLWHHDLPQGDGYQLWETTTEGSPLSPVFAIVEELAEWCAVNATVFAGVKAAKEEWLKMFAGETIHFELGSCVFV